MIWESGIYKTQNKTNQPEIHHEKIEYIIILSTTGLGNPHNISKDGVDPEGNYLS